MDIGELFFSPKSIESGSTAESTVKENMLSGHGGSRSPISDVVTSNSQPVGKMPVWRHMLLRQYQSFVNISSSETMPGLRDFLGPNRELGNFMAQIIGICCPLAGNFAAPFLSKI